MPLGEGVTAQSWASLLRSKPIDFHGIYSQIRVHRIFFTSQSVSSIGIPPYNAAMLTVGVLHIMVMAD